MGTSRAVPPRLLSTRSVIARRASTTPDQACVHATTPQACYGIQPSSGTTVGMLAQRLAKLPMADKVAGAFEKLLGRGFHSSTSHLIRSRLWSRKPHNLPNVSLKKCSRHAEKWTSVSP